MKIVTSLLRSFVFQLSVAGFGLWCVYGSAEYINEHLQNLIVLPADPHPDALAGGDVSANLKQLAPLAADRTSSAPADGNEPIDLNSAFVPPPKVDPATAAPDYFKALKENRTALSLSAITDDGAILNGRFVSYGSSIESVAYPIGNGPKMTAPRLLKANTPGAVSIAEFPGHRTFTLSN